MKTDLYIKVSGLVFAVVSVVHLLRVINGWNLVIGGWPAPMGLSVAALLITGFLAWSAWKLSK